MEEAKLVQELQQKLPHQFRVKQSLDGDVLVEIHRSGSSSPFIRVTSIQADGWVYIHPNPLALKEKGLFGLDNRSAYRTIIDLVKASNLNVGYVKPTE